MGLFGRKNRINKFMNNGGQSSLDNSPLSQYQAAKKQSEWGQTGQNGYNAYGYTSPGKPTGFQDSPLTIPGPDYDRLTGGQPLQSPMTGTPNLQFSHKDFLVPGGPIPLRLGDYGQTKRTTNNLSRDNPYLRNQGGYPSLGNLGGQTKRTTNNYGGTGSSYSPQIPQQLRRNNPYLRNQQPQTSGVSPNSPYGQMLQQRSRMVPQQNRPLDRQQYLSGQRPRMNLQQYVNRPMNRLQETPEQRRRRVQQMMARRAQGMNQLRGNPADAQRLQYYDAMRKRAAMNTGRQFQEPASNPQDRLNYFDLMRQRAASGFY